MTKYSTALITDSTCDIPNDLLAQYSIDFVPCSLLWGSDVLRDRIDISAADFYRRLASDPIYPKTTQPTPEQFRLAYVAAQEKGASEVVVITVSSAMSGTYRAAQLGAEESPIPVTVLDARGPTMSVGWQVLAAARTREAGGDRQAMIAAAERARSGMAQWVSLDTLEYLYKGGRIGNATRLAGTLLAIKPLVYIDHQTGLVESASLVRTRRKSLDLLYQSFFAQLGDRHPARVAVLHGGAVEEAEELAGRIQREQAPCELIFTMTSPVLGVHTGPRAIALCGYPDAA